MKRLVLIDSHAVIHRAFHALPLLTSPAGEPVQAVYGFASILLKLLRELKPDYVVAAFDHEGPTFRHVAFERYKATRVKAPDALYQQIPLVKELVSAFGIPVIEKAGYEADDLIGTIAADVRKHHPRIEVIIATGDLDTLQLVDERTKVFTMRKGVADTVLYDTLAVHERYGLSPHQLTDYKGLRGDPSDNIPGVKGIGEKTATELLARHSSIEQLYRALKKGEVLAKPGIIAALKAHEADALFSKTLATIDRNVPVNFVLASARVRRSGTVQESSRAILERFGFESLLKRMGEDGKVVSVAPPASLGEKKSPIQLGRARTLQSIDRRGPAVLLIDEERSRILVALSEYRVYEVPLAAAAGKGAARWFRQKPPTYLFGGKSAIRLGLQFDPVFTRDLALLWYLLEPGRRSYEANALIAQELRNASPPIDIVEAAGCLFAIAPGVEVRVKKEELLGVYEGIEAPLLPILVAMEDRGIGFDSRPLKALSKKMTAELGTLEKKIHEAAGGPFSINSPRQLGAVIFEKLGLATKGIRKTERSGALSTNEAELIKLKHLHPIVAYVLRYRELYKLKSTYVDALPDLARKGQRIHTTWNQMGTATGRLSSSNPNLQNIPIRSAFGKEIRKAFTAGKGNLLVTFDYSQLELRIAADMAGDEKMMDAFRRGLDIHRLTAAEVNNVPLEQVTPELRQKAKTLNFGVLYGMGARAFAESAGVTRDEAEHFIEEYFHDFAGIAHLIARTKASAHEQGFTKTAFGRKRFFPDLALTNFRLQREAERMAVNHPIQGTEADIMKKAMIEVEAFTRQTGLASDVGMLLQIHDELMFEVKEERVESVVPEIRRIMESIWTGRVPMKVEVKQGKNWGVLEQTA